MQVLERAKQYRPMGAGIGIDVNGMKAIEAIDPSLRKWFNAEGLSLSSSVINDHKGLPPALSPCLPGSCMHVGRKHRVAAILAATPHVSRWGHNIECYRGHRTSDKTESAQAAANKHVNASRELHQRGQKRHREGQKEVWYLPHPHGLVRDPAGLLPAAAGRLSDLRQQVPDPCFI